MGRTRTALRNVSLLAVLFATSLPAAAVPAGPFSVGASLQAVAGQSGDARLKISFTINQPAHLYAEKLSVEIDGSLAQPLALPAPKRKYDSTFDAEVSVYEASFDAEYPVHAPGERPVKVVVHYQGCDEQMCFPPATAAFELRIGDVLRPGVPPGPGTQAVIPPPDAKPLSEGDWQTLVQDFKVMGRDVGYMPRDRFLSFLSAAEAGKCCEKSLQGVLADKGIWLTLLLILVGGAALNLTPCVLPMIPINIAIIGAGAQAGSRRRGLMLGTVYGAGMAVAYGAAGWALVRTGARVGTLQSFPVFNFGIAAVFAALSLSMFGVFELDFSRFRAAGAAAESDEPRRGHIPLVFGMGAVAALLAGACVAPIVISVLLLSANLYAGGHWFAQFLPLVLGVGMALPWPLAGAGLSFLPKPGRWMTKVKAAFGVIVLLFALYYGMEGARQLRSAHPVADGEWMNSLPAALKAAKEQNKPLFVDFWAHWCKNCLAMDKTTFKDPQVQARLGGYVKLRYVADDMDNPAVAAVLDHFEVPGLPTFVVLKLTNSVAVRDQSGTSDPNP